MWDHFVRQEWGKGVAILHLSPILRTPSARRACNPAEKLDGLVSPIFSLESTHEMPYQHTKIFPLYLGLLLCLLNFYFFPLTIMGNPAAGDM